MSSRWAPAAHPGAALVVAMALANGLLIAAICPPFHAPDEQMHFDYVQRLAELHRLPQCPGSGASAEAVALEKSLVDPIARHPGRPLPPLASYRPADPSDLAARQTDACGAGAHYPPLYYLTGALAYRLRASASFLQRLHAVRLVSVIWSAIGALAAYCLGCWYFGRRSDGVLVGAAVSIEPTFALVSNTVNNDAAALALAACCWAALAAVVRARGRLRPLIAVAVFATLGVLTKPTFTMTLPAFIAACVLIGDPRRLKSWAQAGAVFAPAILAAIAWSAFESRGIERALSGAQAQLSILQYAAHWVIDEARFKWLWIEQFWMAWGFLDLFAAPRQYDAIAFFLAAAAAGLCLGWKRFDGVQRATAIFALVASTSLMAAYYAFEYLVVTRMSAAGFVQGRYLLTLYPVHVLAIVLGLRGLVAERKTRIDPAWAFPLLLVPLYGTAFATLILRFYRG